MVRHVGMIVIAVLVVVFLLLGTVAFTVPTTDMVLLKTFGETTHVFKGHEKDEAGLMAKWPYPVQQVVRYDARTFLFEDAETPFQTRDKKQMLVTMFCAWRIADPVKFYKSVETVKAAKETLRKLLGNAKGDVLPDYNMSDFVNTEETSMKLQEIERKVYDRMKAQAEQRYGVEVAMVGIKSLGLPESVTKDVIEAMKKERQKEIKYYEASGQAQATAIRERAKAASQMILAFAETKAAQIRAEGEAAAAKYYERFTKNEALSMFLRQLESLRNVLKQRAVIVLDPQVLEPLGWFVDGPPASAAGEASSSQKD